MDKTEFDCDYQLTLFRRTKFIHQIWIDVERTEQLVHLRQPFVSAALEQFAWLTLGESRS